MLTISPEAAACCPAVFFISGYGGRKEHGLSLGYRLAERGFFFVSFDALYHGERYDRRLDHAADPALGGIYPPDSGLDTGVTFFRVIHQCLLDVETLIEHFGTDPRVDVTRCGVTGPSMGGYASFLIFASIARMQAAVPMIGLPGFTRRWVDLLDECAYSNEEWAAALEQITEQTRAHTAFIRQIDPYKKLKEAAPRALLIMSCDFDSDQPKLYTIYCYRDLLPHYVDSPQRLRIRIYPTGHNITPQMEQDAVEWFYQYLNPHSP